MAVRTQTRQRHELIVAGILNIVDADLGARHELGWIASELNYSERQLRRILADSDIHWRPWLAEQRMRRAALLLTSGRRVQQVARKVGYVPDHFAAPFTAYSGLLPTEARRAGQLAAQLRTLAKHPPRSADVAANCRVVDRWALLHREAIRLHMRAAPGTPVATLLQDAIACAPPRRPRPKPRGRHRRQVALSHALLTAAGQIHVQRAGVVTAPRAAEAAMSPGQPSHKRCSTRTSAPTQGRESAMPDG